MLVAFSALTLLVGWQEGHLACKKTHVHMGVGGGHSVVSLDGVAPSRMVVLSASVNLPLHHKVQKFSSGTGSPGWSRKKGHIMVVVVVHVYTALVWFGSHRREWKASISLSVYLAHKLQFLSLFLHLIFFHEPEQKHRETAGIRSALVLLLLSFDFVRHFSSVTRSYETGLICYS